MKKIFLILAFVLCLTGCSSTSKDGMIKISTDEAIRRLQLEGENSFLLVLTTDNCYSCDEYMKVVEQLQEESSFDLYYINVAETSKDKLDELRITIGDYLTLPMTYYFNEGNLARDNIKSNYIELENYREWLKQLELY